MQRYIETESVGLPADLEVPPGAKGVVVFAHGSGSSRLSPRNRAVAEQLRKGGRLGTLLFDLLSPKEDMTYENRFDIDRLTRRLLAAVAWLDTQPEASGLALGLFGASTGAAAALDAAAALGPRVGAVVSRGGRPDLAMGALPEVHSPTLLIVGGNDSVVIDLNERAFRVLGANERSLEIVPGATHLFEERGAMERVVALTRGWFERYLL